MAWHETPGSTRHDGGYTNMLNRYGSAQDNSSAWEYQSAGIVPDMYLSSQYEGNGLFSKIIDIPAEEAIKHGFDLGLTDADVETHITDTLDYLNWEEKSATALKWARLYGGALGVMLIDDGGGIDEPVNWKRIKGIEEIRIYDRACVWPDYSVMYKYDIPKPRLRAKNAAPCHGMPEFYYINSIYGQFWVHADRCLIFRNGILPERTMQPNYRFWGMPEYVRIKRELRETITSHSTGVKMLERSVQAVYAMKELSGLLAADEGLELVIKRLQTIDQARHLINSIAIDSEGESYEFKSFPMAGVKEVIDTTCNMLSAVTNIPQTILFGRSPAGMNATGESDLENWYNYIERIQKLNLRRNMRTLLDIIIRAGINTGKLTEEPEYNLSFNPMWSMSADEEANVNQTKAQTQKTQADTAKVYFDMSVLDPTEIRKGLAQEGQFCVEDLLENLGVNAESPDLWGSEDDPDTLPELAQGELPVSDSKEAGGVGVIVLKDGKVLTGRRTDTGMICGPGGHIEDGETPETAAVREAQEEFGITPKNMTSLGQLDSGDRPFVFICTEYDGEPKCKSDEMIQHRWMGFDDLGKAASELFPVFKASLGLIPAEMR